MYTGPHLTHSINRITGAYLASSYLLIHMFLKEVGAQGLRECQRTVCLATNQAVFSCQRQVQASTTLLGSMLSSIKLQFCCSCTALCLGLLAETLRWPDFGLGF